MDFATATHLRHWMMALALTALFQPAHALDDSQIVESLEALGEYEAAWPLALKLAEHHDDYRAWVERSNTRHWRTSG